jgi:hypothetical protein
MIERKRKIMRPRIEATSFGAITIEGREIGNDVILRLDGSVQKRKKKLSKKVYGTSHTISLDEARSVADFYPFLSCNHSPHHVACIFSMICYGANCFS